MRTPNTGSVAPRLIDFPPSAGLDGCDVARSPNRRALTGLATLSALAFTTHAAPALTSIGPLRSALWPRLAGIGAQGGVALTFDDGPHPDGTPAVLAGLAELGWSATFFLLGSQVALYPDTARAIIAAGHEVAVHGFDHRNHLGRRPSAIAADLRRANDLINDVTQVRARWFRPPYGVLSAGSIQAAGVCGLNPLLWTAWGRDWTKTTPSEVAATVVRGLRDGGTILLHDSDCTSATDSWRNTVRSLPIIASQIIDQGWTVRTVAEHLGV